MPLPSNRVTSILQLLCQLVQRVGQSGKFVYVAVRQSFGLLPLRQTLRGIGHLLERPALSTRQTPTCHGNSERRQHQSPKQHALVRRSSRRLSARGTAARNHTDHSLLAHDRHRYVNQRLSQCRAEAVFASNFAGQGGLHLRPVTVVVHLRRIFTRISDHFAGGKNDRQTTAHCVAYPLCHRGISSPPG